MTEASSFKRRVRERMSKTGESYTAARAQVSKKRETLEGSRGRVSALADLPSDEKVKEATGKKWDEWFTLLDRWGARERKHGDIAAHLVDEQDVSGWWAQSITVGYERARGIRLKHQQKDGFSISASKTIAAAVAAVFDSFVNARARKKWLPDGTLSLRTSQPERTARFDWGDGSTRVNVSFEEKGPSKTTVALAHERLAGPDDAEAAKLAWRSRLSNLKALLEK